MQRKDLRGAIIRDRPLTMGAGGLISTFQWLFTEKKSDKGNSAVKIDGGGGQDVYLYNVKIGNFPEILMLSLI